MTSQRKYGQRTYFRTPKHAVIEESSSSEDDQNGEFLTEDLEKDFLKVLSHLKKKDPKLYNDNTRFFNNEQCTSKSCSVKSEEKQEEKISQWLKGQKASIEVEEREDLEALHNFWSNPNLDEKEQFLRDYLLDKTFLKQDDEFDPSREIEKLEEEEREVEEQTVFEEKFNYRFENPDEEFLKNYPRTLEKTCGRKSDPALRQVESSEEDEEEKDDRLQSTKHKTEERVELSSESDDDIENSESEDSVVIKEETVTNVIKEPRKLKKLLKKKQNVKNFEDPSKTQIKLNNEQKSQNYKTRLKNTAIKTNIKIENALKPQANNTKTKKKISNLKILLNDIEYLKRLTSHSRSQQTESLLRVHRKVQHILNKRLKKRAMSNLEMNGALPNQNQQVVREVFKNRKQRRQAVKLRCAMPENCLKRTDHNKRNPIPNRRRHENKRKT